ncbi:hypothetical protein ACWA7J_09260 [Leptothrix sp. BB-4]
MAEDTKKPGPWVQLKDLSSFLRDALLTLVVLICIVHPSSIKAFLTESGLSKLGAFGVTVELKEEKEKIEVAQSKVNAAVVGDPARTSDQPPPEAQNKPVDPAFKQAVQEARRVAPQLLPDSGWVFLGRVDADRKRWADGASTTTTAAWPVAPDDVLTVKDDVYVRAITGDKWHSKAPVTTVAKIGDRLKVVEVDYTAAKAGGAFVWVKVAILPG